MNWFNGSSVRRGILSLWKVNFSSQMLSLCIMCCCMLYNSKRVNSQLQLEEHICSESLQYPKDRSVSHWPLTLILSPCSVIVLHFGVFSSMCILSSVLARKYRMHIIYLSVCEGVVLWLHAFLTLSIHVRWWEEANVNIYQLFLMWRLQLCLNVAAIL